MGPNVVVAAAAAAVLSGGVQMTTAAAGDCYLSRLPGCQNRRRVAT